MQIVLFFHLSNILATPSPTGVGQVVNMLTGIRSSLVTILMALGPVVFLVGLVAHGISSSHNSSGGLQWSSRAMRAGGMIFGGALLISLLFSLLQGLLG